MSIHIVNDARREGRGAVQIENEAGIWKVTLDSYDELLRTHGHYGARRRTGVEGNATDVSPHSSHMLEHATISAVRLRKAPRGKYRPQGEIMVCVAPMDKSPVGQSDPVYLLKREDWRMGGSNPNTRYGSPEHMMSPLQWEDWKPHLREVYEWALAQFPDMMPRLPAHLATEVDAAKRHAAAYWSRYKEAENRYLAAQDAYAQAQAKHAEALAARRA